jgi:hypothetical protein
MPGPGDVVRVTHRQAVLITAALAMGVASLAGVAVALVVTGTVEPVLVTTPLLRGAVLVPAVLLLGAARALEARLRESPRGADPAEAAGRWLSGTVVGMALREAVGLLGGVIVLVTGDVLAGLALAAGALLVMLLAAPRQSDLARRLRGARG